MQRVAAHYDGKVLVPHGSVDLPVGEEVEVQISRRPPANARVKAARKRKSLLEYVDGLKADPDSETPTDLAAQHDHYLYGTPKRP